MGRRSSARRRVEPDDILALVQVGALYLPVRSPVAGTLKALSRLREPAGVRQRDRAAAACGCRFREVIRTLIGPHYLCLIPIGHNCIQSENNVKGRSLCRNRRGTYAIFRL